MQVDDSVSSCFEAWHKNVAKLVREETRKHRGPQLTALKESDCL